MKRFYYENSGEPGNTFFIMEGEGGQEHGQPFDIAICVVQGEADAEYLCKRLNQLWENQK